MGYSSTFGERLSSIESQISELEALKSQEGHVKVSERVLEPASAVVPSEVQSALLELSSAFDGAESIQTDDKLSVQNQNIRDLTTKLADFDVNYSSTLLSIDLHRKLDFITESFNSKAKNVWLKSVIVKDSYIKVEKTENSEFVTSNFPHLLEPVIKQLGTVLEESLLGNISSLAVEEEKLVWKRQSPQNITELVHNIEAFVDYLATYGPEQLTNATAKRFGRHLVNTLIHTSFPRLLTDVKPKKEELDSLVQGLNSKLKPCGWSTHSELSKFAQNFDTTWLECRRKRYLAKLRQLYHENSPIKDEKTRAKLIQPKKDLENDSGNGNGNDEWEWNEDEEEVDEVGSGSVVELWKEYTNELGTTNSEPFFVLYRAIVPKAYANNHLWIYSDTLKLLQYLTSAELQNFANNHLGQYIIEWRNKFDNAFLPNLFAQNSQINDLMQTVDSIAFETNEVGGPELRQSIVARLVEQTAVYVINTIEEMPNIGDDESKQFATVIVQLAPLAVYFLDVNAAVPSWNKLEMLKEVLLGNLKSIHELYEQHKLLDFSRKELTSLVNSLFVDSPQRRQVTNSFT